MIYLLGTLAVSVLGAIFFVIKYQEEKDALKDANAVLKEVKKDETISFKVDTEVSDSRSHLRDWLRHDKNGKT